MAYFLIKKTIFVSGNHENKISEFDTVAQAKAEFHSAMGELMKSTRTSECSLMVTDWANHVVLSDSAYIQPTEAEVAQAQAEAEAQAQAPAQEG